MSSLANATMKEKFLIWSKELGISSAENLGANDLSTLFASKHLQNLWKYLIDNVKSEKSAFLIHQNITVHQLQTENKKLETSCSELSNQIDKLNIELQRLHGKVKEKQYKCYQSNDNVASIQRKIDFNFLKSALQVSSLPEITSRKDLIKSEKNNLKNLTSYKLSSNKLEKSSIQKDQLLDSCYTSIRDLLVMLKLQYKNGLKNKQSCDHEYVTFWDKAVTMLSNYEPHVIMEVLCSIIKEDSEKLHQSDSISKYNSDLQSEETPISAIQKMMQKHHLQSKEELELAMRNSSSAAALTNENDQLLQDIRKNLAKTDDFNSIWEFINAELKLKKQESYLHSLQFSLQNLKSELEESNQVQRQLNQMQREVQDFNNELAQNKYEIVEITRQNVTFRQKLTTCQKETLSTATNSIVKRQTDFCNLFTDLKFSVRQQQSSLSSSDICKLQTLQINGKTIPVDSLCIYRHLNSSYEFGSFVYQDIASLFGLDSNKSPADLYRIIIDQINENKLHVNLHSILKQLHSTESKDIKTLQDVKKEVITRNKEHLKEMLSRIQQACNWLQALKTGENKLEVALNEWYEEPAQYQAPWLTLDGNSLKKYKDAQQLSMDSN